MPPGISLGISTFKTKPRASPDLKVSGNGGRVVGFKVGEIILMPLIMMGSVPLFVSDTTVEMVSPISAV